MSDSGEAEAARDERNGEWYRKLVEEANEVTLVVGPDGTVTYVSPAVERLLGYSPSDLVGDDWSKYVYPGDSRRTFRSDRDAPNGPVELRNRRVPLSAS